MEWQLDAACRDPKYDTDMFFVKSRWLRKVERAKRICRKCPVRQACLDFAVTHDCDGIWGGTTKEERIFVALFMTAAKLSEQSLGRTSREQESPTRVGSLHLAGTSYQEIHIRQVSVSASAIPVGLPSLQLASRASQSVGGLHLNPPGAHDHTLSGLSRSPQPQTRQSPPPEHERNGRLTLSLSRISESPSPRSSLTLTLSRTQQS